MDSDARARSRPLRRALIGPPGWRFFSFWLALAITNLGTWAGVVALQLQILDLTGDQAYVSAIVVAEYLPAVILGTVLGHLLDRVPPRAGLAACELLAAAAWALMVTTGNPARSSRSPCLRRHDRDLQDRLDGRRADARRRRGPGRRERRHPERPDAHERGRGVALGGALVGLTSTDDVLLLNAVTFVISGALLLAFSRVPRHAPPLARRRGRAAAAPGSRVRSSARAAACDADAAHDHLQPAGGLGRARHRRSRPRADAARHLRRLELEVGAIMALDALGIAIGTSLPGALRGLSERHGAARDRLGRLRHRARPLVAGPFS